MKLSIPKIRIPYWFGILGGYGFDLLAILTRKKFPISSVRVKNSALLLILTQQKLTLHLEHLIHWRKDLIKHLSLNLSIRRKMTSYFIRSKS